MQVICPHCGELVTSEHINIQRMVAVCPACNSVFPFDLPDSRIKQRKVKPPQRITSEESGDHLEIAFRTNFRLDQSEAFISGVILSGAFTFITLLILLSGMVIASPVDALVSLGFGLLTLMFYYWTALVVYNKTHIEVGDEEIAVSRKPLPGLLSQNSTISLAGMKTIRCEETPASKKEGFDTPRYNVWAEMVDGHRKLIVGDLVEDYGVFVAQRLNEFLDLESTADVSRLLDHDLPDSDLSDHDSEAASGQVPDERIAKSSGI